MIKLGLNTWLWACYFDESNLSCIDTAYELGAEAIDLCVNDPFKFPAEAVAERLAKYDMDVIVTTAMPTHVNAISADPAEREAALTFVKKLLDVAEIVHAPLIGGVNYCGSGAHTGHARTQEEIDRAAAYLKEACAYAAAKGITIAMEPVKRFETHFLNTAQQALELIDLVGAPNLKVHLDTFHMNIEEASIPGAIRSCGDKLAYLHLVENNRDTPGRGHIPWTEVFEALKEIGFEGAGCIETFNPQEFEITSSMTYLTRKFAETPEELSKIGLEFLKKVRAHVYGA